MVVVVAVSALMTASATSVPVKVSPNTAGTFPMFGVACTTFPKSSMMLLKMAGMSSCYKIKD